MLSQLQAGIDVEVGSWKEKVDERENELDKTKKRLQDLEANFKGQSQETVLKVHPICFYIFF